MNKFLITAFFTLCIGSSSYSQFAFKPTLLIPSGTLGSVIKTNAALEILDIDEFDGHWRLRYGGYAGLLTARKDTFPTYLIIEDNQGTHILPGYIVIHPSLMLYGTGGFDFTIKESPKITPYIGCSILFGGMILNYDEYYSGAYSESEFLGGGMLIGMGFRLGAQKEISKSRILFTEFSSSGYLITETGIYSHYDFGVGLIF